MPCIYSRFMEKEAKQWREIYKVSFMFPSPGFCTCLVLLNALMMQALQLLEYIIKNGSERVVDDARSHLSTIKMLRNFHYIDDTGKDHGINGKLFILLSVAATELVGSQYATVHHILQGFSLI